MLRHNGILVVDDDRDLSMGLVRLLEESGYHASCVFDGKSGLLELENSHHHALIILDLKLPDMNGVDFVEALRQFRRKPKVIVLTGHGSIESAVKLTQMGVAKYLEKPFQPEELLSLVKDYVGDPAIEGVEEKIGRLIRTRFRLARQEQGMTIKELAKRTDLSASLVSQIETGKISPSLSSLVRMAQGLELSLKSLFED